jgi:hypothetical protein
MQAFKVFAKSHFRQLLDPPSDNIVSTYSLARALVREDRDRKWGKEGYLFTKVMRELVGEEILCPFLHQRSFKRRKGRKDKGAALPGTHLQHKTPCINI